MLGAMKIEKVQMLLYPVGYVLSCLPGTRKKKQNRICSLPKEDVHISSFGRLEQASLS
jgi:hypothetical protein